jgi:hypothetical protein
MRDAKQVENALIRDGRSVIHLVLDRLDPAKYKEFTQGLTFHAICDMSVVEITACMRMPHEHALLLYQAVQKYEDGAIAYVNPESPPPRQTRQTHVPQGTSTPQPEDKMELDHIAKDGGETVIYNKQEGVGKVTRLCVVRDHDIRHLSMKEKRRFFKDRYDEEMPLLLERRAVSEVRSARKRKRAEDTGGSGAGGGSASGGAPKKKRG